MNITKSNTLSFYNEQGVLTLTAKQYDTGRRFSFNIIADDEPFDLSNCTAYLRILKADGTQFEGEECCSISGNTIIIDTSISNGEQILTASGLNKCEIHLTDDNGKSLTTWDFNIEVKPRVHDGSHIDSIDSWDAWDKIKDDVYNLKINLDKKANIDSPILTGTPKAPTAAVNTNTEQIATTAFVQTAFDNSKKYADTKIADLIDGAPKTLDTLKEIADAVNENETIVETLDASIGNKVDKIDGKGLSTNDFTNDDKERLNNLAQSSVTGVKGNSESSYRAGNVNLTAEDVGALSLKKGGTVNNTFIVNKKSTTNPTGLNEIMVDSDGKVGFLGAANGVNSTLMHLDASIPTNKTITMKNANHLILPNDVNGPPSVTLNINGAGNGIHLEHKNHALAPNVGLWVTETGVVINSEDGDLDISERAPDFVGAAFNQSIGHIRLYTPDIYIGQDGDFFIQAKKVLSSNPTKTLKLRGGRNASIEIDGSNNIIFGTDGGELHIRDFSTAGAPDIFTMNKNGNVFRKPVQIYGDLQLQPITTGSNGRTRDSNLYFGNGNYSYLHGYSNELIIHTGQNGNTEIELSDTGIVFRECLEEDEDYSHAEVRIGGKGFYPVSHDNHQFSLGMKDSPWSNLFLSESTETEENYEGTIYTAAINTDERGLHIESWDDDEQIHYKSDFSGERIQLRNGGYSSSSLCRDAISFHNETGKISLSDNRNYGTGGATASICLQFQGSQYLVYPSTSSNITTKNFGTSATKWTNIYATNGTIQTSDRNEKNTINELTAEKAQNLIYGLKPSTYQMNSGTSRRTHWGMISQDIEELLEKLGWTSLDFAGFIKSPKKHIEEEERDPETGKVIKERVEENIEGEYDYSLRYDEFIAPIIKVIQVQCKEIETLKQEMDLLKQKISDVLNT